MNSRDMILEKLHAGAASGHTSAKVMTAREPGGGDVQVFILKAAAAGAGVTRTSSAAAVETIKSIFQESGCKSIMLSDEKIIKELGIQNITQEIGIDCRYTDDFPGEAYRRKVLQVEGGVSGCDYALSDSGSLVILHNGSNQRLLSLAPDIYFCLVKTSQMLKDRYDLAAILEQKGMPAAVTLITGVSRTADVALQVVLGMHGPRKVYIVLIED